MTFPRTTVADSLADTDLYGAQALADDGPVLAADVGGATTDAHSVGESEADPGLLVPGLPEPRLKRIVDGDIGLRVGSPGIVRELELDHRMARWCGGLDVGGLRAASDRYQNDLAVFLDGQAERNVGYAPGRRGHGRRRRAAHRAPVGQAERRGRVQVQKSKSLTGVTELIGSGGISADGGAAAAMLVAATADPEWRDSLRPAAPRLSVDADYCLFAARLLADIDPGAARVLARSSLSPAI